jgi:DNA-binding NarL/FixJ family response regulator
LPVSPSFLAGTTLGLMSPPVVFAAKTTTAGHAVHFYLHGMSLPCTPQKLHRKLAALVGEPAWIVLCPSSSAHASAWVGDHVFQPVDPVLAAEVAAAAPTGGHLATNKAEWVRAYFSALFGQDHGHAIYCHTQRGIPVAMVGWRVSHGAGLADLRRAMSVVRQTLRSMYLVMRLETEAAALRHVLGNAESSVAAVRPDGEIIGSSLSARELLGQLAHGPRHYYHRDLAPLPASLIAEITRAVEGQRRLSRVCTARFGPLQVPGADWCPVLVMEFFEEKAASPGIRLSCLTPVEREVFHLLAQGATNPEIARDRGVSPSTVKHQVASIFDKAGVRRRTELIAAHLQGLTGSVANSTLAMGLTR